MRSQTIKAGLISLVFASLALTLGCASEEKRVTETYGAQIEDVEALLDNVAEYEGRRITVPGEVQDKTESSFILESGGAVANRIIVIPSENVDMEAFNLLGEDNNVSVIGQLVTTPATELESQLGRKLSADLKEELRGQTLYLIADQIVPQPD